MGITVGEYAVNGVNYRWPGCSCAAAAGARHAVTPWRSQMSQHAIILKQTWMPLLYTYT